MSKSFGNELVDSWKQISKDFSLEKDEGKLNPFYMETNSRREKINQQLDTLKEIILQQKKETKLVDFQKKKTIFLEYKFDKMINMLRLGKFFELSNVVQHISNRMEVKFGEFHMVGRMTIYPRFMKK
jgi:hypothetical protein